MKKIFYGSVLCIIPIIVLIIWYNYSDIYPTFVNAQTTCINPVVDTNGIRWETGANVTVKIHSAFTKYEQNSIIAAFEEWNAKRVLTCSNVVFSGFEILDAQPPAQRNWAWVGFDPDTTGTPGIMIMGSEGFARIYLNGRIRLCHPDVCPRYVKILTLHEIGHSFQLTNAGNCGNSSIMCSPVGSNPVITACNIGAVATVYCPSPTPTPDGC